MTGFFTHERRDYSKRLPMHFCRACTFVMYPEEESCPECGAERPDAGWAETRQGFDRWLAEVIDGRYVVTKLLGRGAVGAVYRAESLGIRRDFAIKIIDLSAGSAGIDPEQVRSRLHREIDAMSRLRNPHVVPFYEVVELRDGSTVAVVMDFVRGKTLERMVLDSGAITPARAVLILRQIANGVHEAHEAGMIHRDLKPENIMVDQLPSGDDFAHVLDFGIVHVDDGVKMTQGFLGTPLYASPEQAMAASVDRRSDIYSLGAMLFFMLTGRPPFVSESIFEILQSHVRTPAPTLSAVTRGHSFPSELEELVAEMLAKAPDHRPQTLGSVVQTLDDLIHGGVLHDDDPSPPSVELDVIRSESGSATLDGLPANTGAGDEYAHETNPGLDSESSSVFESRERDPTGPKAAILRRSGSHPSPAMAPQLGTQFDRVLTSGSGLKKGGIPIPDTDVRCATVGADESIGVVTAGGEILLVAPTEGVRTLGEVQGATSLAVGGGRVLVGTDSGEIQRRDDGRELLFRGDSPITALAADGDGKLWLAATQDDELLKADVSLKSWTTIAEKIPVATLAISAKRDTYVTANGPQIKVFSVGAPRVPFSTFSLQSDARSVAFSRDGHLLGVACVDGTIAIHAVVGGSRIHSFMDPHDRIQAVTFTADNELVGFFVDDGVIFRRNLHAR